MTLPRKPFYFIRHGETAFNQKGIIMGSIDEPLNDRGFEQARQAALILEKISFDLIVSSPRKRAHQTAQTIADHCNRSIILDMALSERNWGVAEGKPLDPTKPLFDDAFTPEGAEPFKEFRARILKALKIQLETHQDKTLLIVSHGGVFKALCDGLMPHSSGSSANAVPYLCHPPEDLSQSWMIREVGVRDDC